MTVGAKNHLSASGHHLTHILVKNCPVWRNENTAILFRVSKAKDVVILIDGAAHRAEGVVAVGKHVGNRELFDSAGPGRLQNVDIVVIRRHQRVKFQLELLHIVTVVMGL